MNDYTSIGKIVATFGLEGELVLLHSLGKKTALKDVKAVFIEEMKGSYIPWFLQSSKAKNEEEIFLQLEGITSKEAARRLTNKKVWLLTADFRRLVGKTSPVALLGYTIFDEDEPVGTIEEVIEQPHQVLLRTTYRQKEALIPLHQETLLEIDHKKQQVIMSLPEGLLDIFL